MKKRLISTLLVLCMVLGILPGTAAATEQTDTWDGVSVDTDWYTSNKNATTFTISTAAQLAGLAELVNNDITRFDNKTITLDRDIDLNGHQWTSIGSKETSYGYWGNFNGNNHTITNLAINITDDYGGIFGKISRGTVENLSVSGIVSTSHNSSTITVYPVGGIVASTSESSAIQNCSFSGEVSGYASVGGIVGSNSRGIVRKCSNSGSVTAELQRSGGIVGSNFGTIELCCNTGPVSTVPQEATGGSVGGISGDSLGNIIQCYNTGNVQGTHSTGGIVGMAERGTVISDSYNVGTVSINKYQSGCGGIVGYVDDLLTVENCYNVGTLNGGSISVGGIIGNGKNKSSISNCFYLSQEGISLEEAISRSDFATQDTFVGWDFDTIWEMSDELHRPVLRNCSENSAGGDIPIDPPEPVNPKIISLYPANRSTFDHTSTSGNKAFHITFDREVSNAGGNRPQLDFSVGTLEVHKASDDSVVYQVTESPFTPGVSSDVSLYGSSAPYIAISITGITPELDHDTEYYVTMPAGFIKMADGTGSPKISKGDWKFTSSTKEAEIITPIEAYVAFKLDDGIVTKIPTVWDENWFKNNATTYIRDLAITSAVLSGASYVEDSTGKPRDKSIEEALLSYGFKKQNISSYNYDDSYYDSLSEENSDHVAYTFASKNIVNSSGETIPLVVIIIKGTSGNEEWYSNFNMGINYPHHAGIEAAKEELLSEMEQYMERYGINNERQVKFLITGHSRGAGVANLVAAELTKSPSFSSHNYNYGKGNVYAYTFASPAVTAQATEAGYTNIFNIVSEEDFVTRLALADWGFGRYGISLALPNKSDYGRGYDTVYENMSTEYRRLFMFAVGEEKEHESFGGTKSVDDVVDEFYDKAETRYDYYNTKWLTADTTRPEMTLYDYVHDELCGAMLYKEYWDYVSNLLGAFSPITWFFVDHHVLHDHVFSAHSLVTYYSWLESCSTEELFGVTNTGSYRVFKRLNIACPVDVYVYDETKTVVAEIINNVITTNTLATYVEDEIKTIDIPTDQNYSIRIVATDNGHVSYTIEERSIRGTDSSLLRVVNFKDIEINTTDELTGQVNDVLYTDKINYVLIKNNAEKIYADYDSYIPPYVDPGITPTPSYPSDESTGNRFYSIALPIVSGGTITANPTNATTGATVTLTATLDFGYELSSLTVTDSKGNKLDLTDKGSGKYTFVMPASAVTVNAVFEKTEPAETAPVDETYLFPFTDVLRADWFYDAVEYAFNKNLMNGIAPYTFDPQGKMTRAMVWTVLGRMADADVDGSDSPWYAKAQTWATVNNVSDGTNPTGNVSRQELTTMLWRYIGSPAATADLSKFSDSESVADWADGAMQWAVSTGLIVGDDGRLNPNGDAKRCEVATLFMRFCETISE